MYGILIYGFPLVLLAFEWGLRTLLQVESWGFTGPTLAAAGLSFLVPLTRPKELNIPLNNAPNAVAISKGDRDIFVPLAFLLVFVFMFAWCWSCYISIKKPNAELFGMSTHLVIGSIVYLISVVMTFVKEKI